MCIECLQHCVVQDTLTGRYTQRLEYPTVLGTRGCFSKNSPQKIFPEICGELFLERDIFLSERTKIAKVGFRVKIFPDSLILDKKLGQVWRGHKRSVLSPRDGKMQTWRFFEK